MLEKFGLYRYLPLFFLTGAAIELFMIKVRIGRETFCEDGANRGPFWGIPPLDDTVVRKEAQRRAEQNQTDWKSKSKHAIWIGVAALRRFRARERGIDVRRRFTRAQLLQTESGKQKASIDQPYVTNCIETPDTACAIVLRERKIKNWSIKISIKIFEDLSSLPPTAIPNDCRYCN